MSPILRRVGKTLCWFAGILLGLFALLFLLLQIPAVQQRIARLAEQQAAAALNGGQLRIGSVDLDLASGIELDDVRLLHPDGDTLARLGYLGVKVDFLSLLRREVSVSRIVLRDTYARIVRNDTLDNLAFLLPPLSADTTATPPPPDTATAASSWTINAAGTRLLVERTDVYYEDAASGLLLDLDSRRLAVALADIDLAQQYYQIDYVELDSTRAQVALTPTDSPTDTTAASPLQLGAGRLTVTASALDVQLEGLRVQADLPRVNLEGSQLRQDSSLVFRGENFQAAQLACRIDTDAPPLVGPGIDYNHLDIQDLLAEVTDIAYVGDSLHLRARQLTARENRSGFQLEKTRGQVAYSPAAIRLEDFLLRTSHSTLQSPNTLVGLGFTPADDGPVRATLVGHLGFRDLALLVPALGQQPLFREQPDGRFDFDIASSGTLARLRLPRLHLTGPGLRLRASGRVNNALDPGRADGRLALQELRLLPAPLLPFVPDSLLPAGVQWPREIVAEGQARYQDDQLQLDLFAREHRPEARIPYSRLRTQGGVAGLRAYPATRLDVRLDTLLVSETSLLAWLPPDLLPPGYQLPDYLRSSGSVSGPLDALDLSLQLALPDGKTAAALHGQVNNVLAPDSLRFDLTIDELDLRIADVAAILPDSTLPANLQLPDLRIRKGTLRGRPDDLRLNVPVQSDNGDWDIVGRYRPSAIDLRLAVRSVDPAALFTRPLRDTLAQLGLGQLNVETTVTGALAPALDLSVAATVGNAEFGNFLELDAALNAADYAATFKATHPKLKATGQGKYALGPDSIARVQGQVKILRADLQYWEVTQAPLLVEGKIATDITGLDPYALDGQFRMDSVRLRGRNGSSFVDSLVMTAQLKDRQNTVLVRSEVLDMTLEGYFDPLATPQKMVRFLQGYLDESLRQPQPVEDGESLALTLDLKRPQPLTGGLIDGLEVLAPFTTTLRYREMAPEFLFELALPEIGYAGLSATDLRLRTTGTPTALELRADWADIRYGNQMALGQTALRANTRGDALATELLIRTPTDSVRHRLGLTVDLEGDSLLLAFAPEQLLNFAPWQVTPRNQIILSESSLVIRDLLFQNGRQSLAASTTEPGDVAVTLKDFDLRTVGRLLFSDEETIGGIVNGSVGIDNALTNPGIRSDLQAAGLRYGGVPLGDLRAAVTSQNEQTYQVDVALSGKGNDTRLTGTVQLDGPLRLRLEVPRLQLAAAEPFSLGYLNESEGYLSGQVDINGTLEAPQLEGALQFNAASLVISLLGERFRLDEKPIRFTGSTIRFGDNWRIFDSGGRSAQVRGEVRMRTLADIDLDLRMNTDNFLAINSTEDDNPDWYGKMFVAAVVTVAGTAVRPVVEVQATTSRPSTVTYVYRIPDAGLIAAADVVTFAPSYQWRDLLRPDTSATADSLEVAAAGLDLQLTLDVKPDLEVTVVVDPVTEQAFTGRANGELTLQMYPDGRQEATGRVVLQEGIYDFNYQGVINKQFSVRSGSSATFSGDLLNPDLDLRIRHRAKTAPLALVEGVLGAGGETTGLRREQTFFVDVNLAGPLNATEITTDVVYPADAYGNLGLERVGEALAVLRRDQSRLTTTAFQLLAFGSFNIPLLDSGGGGGNLAATTLNNLMSNYLNNFADQLVGFVNLDFGLDSYQDESGKTQTNLRVSLRKTLFDDRVIISVDGVAGTAADELAGTRQTYLDNITAEYLINEDGTFRLRFFNDQDRSTLVGDNVIRFGGRLSFGQDFDRIRWSGKGKE